MHRTCQSTCRRRREQRALECVCAVDTCRSFADAVANTSCGIVGSVPIISRGCGFTLVEQGNGIYSSAFAYEGADNTLVGASVSNDVPASADGGAPLVKIVALGTARGRP